MEQKSLQGTAAREERDETAGKMFKAHFELGLIRVKWLACCLVCSTIWRLAGGA